MFYQIARTAVRIYYTIFFKVSIIGKENIPHTGGIVLCSNHTSNHDPAILGAYTPRILCYMAKKELFKIKVLAWFISHLHAFPVDRNTTDMAAFKKAIHILKSGGAIGIFAQGTRVKPGEEKAAKAGVALFSLKTNAPIVPVAISGKFKLFSNITVQYGLPLYLEEYKNKRINNEVLDEVTEIVMKKINQLKVEG